MAKFTVLIQPINATPKNYPINFLKRIRPRLKKHLERVVAPMLVKDMEATVENWNTKPRMVSQVTTPFGTRLQLVVFPQGRGTLNWKRISEGTGPRYITAKSGKGMYFKRNYDPKTTSSGKYGGPGKKYGPFVRANVVRHSIEPRKFTIKIIKRREKGIRRGVKRVVFKARII